MQTIDYRRGLPAMAACFLIWGFQPLYWYMCTNVCGEIDTTQQAGLRLACKTKKP